MKCISSVSSVSQSCPTLCDPMHKSLLIICNKYICHYSHQNLNHSYHPSKISCFFCAVFSLLSWNSNYMYVQFSSVAQSCLTLGEPMNHSMPGLPVHHQLPEFIQTHVHWVGDAIQPSHPLSSPSPPALNLSQHQGLLKWVSSSHQVANLEPLGKSNYGETGKP